jgi:HSP90 family molecular chaperone
MKKGQEQIYYLAGENKEAIEKSPLIEKLVKRGYEVLYMIDPIDEYTLGNMGEKYDGKHKLTNVAREQLKLDGEEVDEEKEKEVEKEYEGLFKFLKKHLGGKVT